jgi:hypothetical protein
MHLTKVHLFAILLLALVFCSFFSDICSGSSLEGFNSSNPYDGKGQYSDQYSNYGKMYSAKDKGAKGQNNKGQNNKGQNNKEQNNKEQNNKEQNHNDKPVDSDHNDDDGSRSYAPYNSGTGAIRDSSHMKPKYHSSQGIPASQIPGGQEDLYMLKSEIVPPVCPACPAMKCNVSDSNGGGSGGEKKCPPCPPCARCPEPAFECKKVPNYDSVNDNAFPRPILNSFSQFGL